jgi:hypothetical protein
MISAIRESGRSDWSGHPSKKLLDSIDKKLEADTEKGEFFQILKSAIIEIDRKRDRVWFANKERG